MFCRRALYRCVHEPALPSSRAFFAAAAALASPRRLPRASARPAHPNCFRRGLDKPVDFQPDPTRSPAYYVVEQTGNIRVIEDGKTLEKPFLPPSPPDKINARGWEQGALLGLAFRPHFAQNKLACMLTTPTKGRHPHLRFTASDACTCDPATEEVLAGSTSPSPTTAWRVRPLRARTACSAWATADRPATRKNAQGSLLGQTQCIDSASPGGRNTHPQGQSRFKTNGASRRSGAYGLQPLAILPSTPKGPGIGDVGQGPP